MRRIIVAGFLLAGAVSLASAGGVSAGQFNPCLNPESATKSLSQPGTLNGTSGNDILFGSPGPDVINGKGGNDIICGNGGPDKIDGGSGDDRIQGVDTSIVKGGSGNDWIIVSAGSTAYGGSGNDVIYASNGSFANGDSGRDSIFLDESASGANGGSGDDLIVNQGENQPAVDCGSGFDIYNTIGITSNQIIIAPSVRCEKFAQPG